MSTGAVNPKRRWILNAVTGVVGAVGLGYAAVPFVKSMSPSAKVLAKATTTVDLEGIEPGQLVTRIWQGKPVWILRRSEAQLATLEMEEVVSQLKDPQSQASKQPEYAENRYRSRQPEWFVAVAICTHLGCVPSYRPKPEGNFWAGAWEGGFFCPCHGSAYDLAGRVMAGSPAPRNLAIPPYEFLARDRLRIGQASA